MSKSWSMARGLAPLLFLAAFVHCSADAGGLDSAGGEQPSAAEAEDVASENELELGVDDATEAEALELGQLSQPLEVGAACTEGASECVSVDPIATRCVSA